MLQQLRCWLSDDRAVIDQANQVNLRRLHFVALVAAPIHLLHVAIFLFGDSADGTEAMWRSGIIAAHSVMFLLMSFFAIATAGLSEGAAVRRWRQWLPTAAVWVALLAGASIVAIDQLVTPAITPFLVVCTLLAAVFLLRPLMALFSYAAAFGMFWFAIGLTQTDPSILLSNRVNGITAVGIGICLSFILWQSHRRHFHQQRCIERQQQELEAKNRELEHLALYDPLTGLLNRRSFEELAQRELAAMQRHGHRSAIAIMDVDHFKTINDARGHPVGDQVLRQLSRILSERLRKNDVVSRWGGEEFVILFPHTGLTDVLAVAEGLRKLIAETPFEVGGEPVRLTASFGLAELVPDVGALANGYRDADAALYAAKRGGRNRIEVARLGQATGT